MTEIDLTDSRAEDAQPRGFVPSHLATPMLRSSERTAWDYTARTLGEMRLRSAIAEGVEDATTRSALLEENEREATRLQRMARAFAVGVLPALLVVAALVAGPTVGRAEAMEAPQPDPVAAQTVSVVLGAAPVTVYVRATAYTPTAPGWWCASVWTARGRVGGTCSIGASFPIPVTVDPRAFPVGRSFAQVVDDATDVAVGNVTFDARRPSAFQRGTFLDMGRGDLYVSAPLTMYSAPVGRYVPQQYSPAQVQVAGRHGWVTVATLTTTRYGVASGIVHLGGGLRVFRVVRPAGVTVWSTVGITHRMSLLTEPVDVI